MKRICIFNDDELEKEFLDVDIISKAVEICLHGRSTETVEFFFDKYIDHNPKQVWTGKFVCVTNFKNNLHYTPGKIYKASKERVYDDTAHPYIRGSVDDEWIFSAGPFEELQKDFLEHNIDIIEYKGEA